MSKRIVAGSCLMVFIVGGIFISKVYSQPSTGGITSNQQREEWTEENIENEKIWTSQPILSDLLYRKGFADDLQKVVGLNNEQVIKIQNLATEVLTTYRVLDSESRVMTTDTHLTQSEKSRKIKEMGYNQRILHEVNAADKNIKNILTKDQYDKFVYWVEKKHQEAKETAEEYKHKPRPETSNAPVIVLPAQK